MKENGGDLDALLSLVESVRVIHPLREKELLDDAIMEHAVKLVGAGGGSLMMVDESSHRLILEKVVGLKKETCPRTIEFGERIEGWVAQTGMPLLITRMENELRFAEIFEPLGIVSTLVVPIKIRRKTAGVLTVFGFDSNNVFKDRDLTFLTLFASQISIAIENARLYEEVKKASKKLEEKVKERTAELEEKTRELEKFNRLFVGRELRIGELKEEIKRLKEEIKRRG